MENNSGNRLYLNFNQTDRAAYSDQAYPTTYVEPPDSISIFVPPTPTIFMILSCPHACSSPYRASYSALFCPAFGLRKALLTCDLQTIDLPPTHLPHVYTRRSTNPRPELQYWTGTVWLLLESKLPSVVPSTTPNVQLPKGTASPSSFVPTATSSC